MQIPNVLLYKSLQLVSNLQPALRGLLYTLSCTKCAWQLNFPLFSRVTMIIDCFYSTNITTDGRRNPVLVARAQSINRSSINRWIRTPRKRYSSTGTASIFDAAAFLRTFDLPRLRYYFQGSALPAAREE
jgi:hypothetical protein